MEAIRPSCLLGIADSALRMSRPTRRSRRIHALACFRISTLTLHRIAHGLREKHALFGAQLELLGRVLLVAIVKPCR